MTAATANLLYAVFALGAVAVYFMLPHGERRWGAVGIVVGLAALAALTVFLAARVIAPDRSTGYFLLFSAIAIAAAARVISHPRPVYNALYFVLVVVSVAALMVLLGAEFLAIALVIIYAGAILVTYLFVIMLAQQQGSLVYDRRSREPLIAVLAGFALMAGVAGRAGDLPASASQRARSVTRQSVGSNVVLAQEGAGALGGLKPDDPARNGGESGRSYYEAGNTQAVGAVVMTDYVVALEVGGVLLLISMVGAITLSHKRVAPDPFRAPPRPLGEIGKGVQPF